MSQTQHVLEYSSPTIQGNVIKGVKIVGTKSANGRTYPAAVLQQAIALYESAPVFILHPDPREKRQGSRLLRHHLGNLENVTANANGLFGDLTIKPAHAVAKHVLEAAPSAPFGLSHNVLVEINGDETEVSSIIEVFSVDLVDDPATTKNLFEEKSPMENEMKALEAAVTKLTERFDLLEGKNKPGPTKRLTALEQRGDGDGEPTPIGNTHEDFMAGVRGFPLT